MDDILFDIKLEECGLIKCNISDPVYKFCLLNNVNNVGDFIKKYHEKRFDMDRRHNFNYFDGIVDLIKLFYLDHKLIVENNMLKKIELIKMKNPYCNYARVKNEHYNESLRRLGFTQSETSILLSHGFYLNKEVSIITIIKSYLNNNSKLKIHNKEEQSIFLKKLNILNEYYDKNIKSIERKDFSLDNVTNKLLYLQDLYKKREILEKKLLDVSTDLQSELSKLPQDDLEVKALVKRYDKINCKIN